MGRKDLFRALPFAEQHTETMGDVSYWRHNELKLPSPIFVGFLEKNLSLSDKNPFLRSLNSTYRCCNNAFLLSNCTLKPCKNAPNRDKKNSLAFANETKCLSFCLKLFYFRFGQEFLQKLFYTEILFKSLIQHGATFFLKLFISYFRLKNHFTFPHIDFTLFDTIANNERFQYYQKDDRHIFVCAQ